MSSSNHDIDEAPTDPKQGIVPRTSERPEPFHARACVLVADDDEDVRALVAAILRCDGYDVIEARNGSEAFESILHADAARRPTLVLSDVRMPGLTGLALLERLRERDVQVPVLLMTAYGAEGLREAAEGDGATAVFQKPFDVDDLRTAVMNIADRARAAC